MKWLRRLVDRAVADRPPKPTGGAAERAELVALASSMVGRLAGRADPDAADRYDEQVRAAASRVAGGEPAEGLEALAEALRDGGAPITIEELSRLGRLARAFVVPDDRWTFVGACVERA